MFLRLQRSEVEKVAKEAETEAASMTRRRGLDYASKSALLPFLYSWHRLAARGLCFTRRSGDEGMFFEKTEKMCLPPDMSTVVRQ